LEEIVSRVSVEVSISLGVDSGCLIDFETTGIPGQDEDVEVVTLGYYFSNRIRILQRLCRDKRPFYRELGKVIDGLPRPFYAYNADFERQIITGVLGADANEWDFVDIYSPWKLKAEQQGIHRPRLDNLMPEPEDFFYGRDKVRGSDVPRLWRTYLATGEVFSLRRIMEHCYSDVTREIVLYCRYLYITRSEV
jgi:hypothetical protein